LDQKKKRKLDFMLVAIGALIGDQIKILDWLVKKDYVIDLLIQYDVVTLASEIGFYNKRELIPLLKRLKLLNNESVYCILTGAAYSGDLEFFKDMLKLYFDVTGNTLETPEYEYNIKEECIEFSLQSETVDKSQYLMNRKFDSAIFDFLTKGNEPALRTIVECDNLELFKKNTPYDCEMAVRTAVRCGATKILRFISSEHPDLLNSIALLAANVGQYNILFWAIDKGATNIQELIEMSLKKDRKQIFNKLLKDQRDKIDLDALRKKIKYMDDDYYKSLNI
ncbi:MAG: hypothetical protein ACYCST_22040, partial [Acidimicrobiales bacterium]